MALPDNTSIDRAAADIYRRHFKQHYEFDWDMIERESGMIHDICMGLAADMIGQSKTNALPVVIPEDIGELMTKVGAAEGRIVMHALSLASYQYNERADDPSAEWSAELHESELRKAVIEAAPLFQAVP